MDVFCGSDEFDETALPKMQILDEVKGTQGRANGDGDVVTGYALERRRPYWSDFHLKRQKCV